MSTIYQDRKEKWDILYKGKTYIDVKATYNESTKKYSINETDIDDIRQDKTKYFIFINKEIKNWKQSLDAYRNKNNIQLYLISSSDILSLLDSMEHKSGYFLISDKLIEDNKDKFRKFIK